MDKQTQARYDAKAIVIKAMAHPTRLLIIEELAKREHCVCELTGMIGADTSTVSKHLALLKSAGVVSDEKRGQLVYYSLKMPCIINFLSCLEKTLKENAKVKLAMIA